MSQNTRADIEGDKVYMAPELLNGHPCFASDIFSLGLLLLELSADIDLPTEGEAWQQLRRGDLSHINFRDRSAALLEVIYMMLRPSPENRPSATDILVHSSSFRTGQRYHQSGIQLSLDVTMTIPNVSEAHVKS